MRELRPGLFHWTTFHEGIRAAVSSYYVEPAGAVIDARVPEEGIEAALGGRAGPLGRHGRLRARLRARRRSRGHQGRPDGCVPPPARTRLRRPAVRPRRPADLRRPGGAARVPPAAVTALDVDTPHGRAI